MDAPTEKDEELQRSAGQSLLDLKVSLPRYLWNQKSRQNGETNDRKTVRTVARYRTLDDLIKLVLCLTRRNVYTLTFAKLEPFQEWPQLLDPHLSGLLFDPVTAFLAYLEDHVSDYHRVKALASAKCVPLPRAICKILYIFCKVRGPKVISRFLNNEPKYLELMLVAFKSWSKPYEHQAMMWEERYIILLWLSHLMLAPFDLSSIISASPTTIESNPLGFQFSSSVPFGEARILSICFEYLTAAGKERESAVSLLVRLALRPDMLRIGLLDAVIKWAISFLDSEADDSISKTIYSHIGVLSVLAAICSSGEMIATQPYFLSILSCIQRINTKIVIHGNLIKSSAVARKIIIKILRSMVVLQIQADNKHGSPGLSQLTGTILEETIDHLLTALGDKDTPVRSAASKSLGAIATRLESNMATQVIEAVLQGLQENAFWRDQKLDLAAVNPLRWHGSILALSYFLYQRSPPLKQLSVILDSLILGLSFEQRSSVGSATGTSVRDAACFGLWSLARRYTTNELLAVEASTLQATSGQNDSISILQVLANELVIVATLDPSGNIRRGASAALQEFVGRHPDKIADGIHLVQIVDYHAVAMRSKAFNNVAIDAAKLNLFYWNALFNGVLGWRGVGSLDTDSRRLAALAIGSLSTLPSLDGIESCVTTVRGLLNALSFQDTEKRHGLMLALSAIVTSNDNSRIGLSQIGAIGECWTVFRSSHVHDEIHSATFAHRPVLSAEASCALINALARFSSTRFDVVTLSDSDIKICASIIALSLSYTEDIVVARMSSAASSLAKIMQPRIKCEFAISLIESLGNPSVGKKRRPSNRIGTLEVIGSIFAELESDPKIQQSILKTLVAYALPDQDIETRVAAIKSLSSGVLAKEVIDSSIANALSASLGDYTTDQRGDIGSLIRIEAISAVGVAWEQGILSDLHGKREIISKVCGLAVEKLNRVRVRAWSCLLRMWSAFGTGVSPRLDFVDSAATSTMGYFSQLLFLSTIEWVRRPLLECYITSAGIGSEAVLRASRRAIVLHLEQLPEPELLKFATDFLQVFKEGLQSERLIIPSLEVCGFLLEYGVFERLPVSTLNWRDVFRITQEAHFKAKNVQKLKAAIYVYAGLSHISIVEQDARLKLCNLMLHSFPSARYAAVEALYTVTQNEELVAIDWSQSPRELLGFVDGLRTSIKRSR